MSPLSSLCPKCETPTLQHSGELHQNTYMFGLIPMQYMCLKHFADRTVSNRRIFFFSFAELGAVLKCCYFCVSYLGSIYSWREKSF